MVWRYQIARIGKEAFEIKMITPEERKRQRQLWVFTEDMIRIRESKKLDADGKLESDAKVLNRILRQIDDQMKETENKLNIRFDGRIIR